MKETRWKGYLLKNSIYLTFWKRQCCKDRKWQGLSGAEVWGGDQWHRGPGGMKRKFHVSYGGGVCDSYMIIHISYSSLNLRRIKLVISKLCIPQTWVNSDKHLRCHSCLKAILGHFFSWLCSLHILLKFSFLSTAYEDLLRVSRNFLVISGLSPF